MNNKKPILVTGSHRSGSTWVGQIIAQSPSIGYIHEPLNLVHRPGICRAKLDYWFPYISDQNEFLFVEAIQSTLKFQYNLSEEIKAIKSLKDGLRAVRDYWNFYQYRTSQARPLVKDPIAFFSAEWLAAKFDMDVVVLIRHPAAFVSSLKIKNWTFPFTDLWQQPLLIQKYLPEFEDEIKSYAEQEHDIVEQAILLWKLFYSTTIKYQQKHPDWIFVRHEDLSLNPLQQFESLLGSLEIDFNEEVKEKIRKYSGSENPQESPKVNKLSPLNAQRQIKRDSKANIHNWKKRLTASEIEKVRSSVEEISRVFYSDDDW